jgi:hypothetical protein
MAFAVAVFRFCRTVRRDDETWDVVRQLRRAASVEVELVARSKAAPLLKESNELVAIFTASRKTVEARLEREAAKKAKTPNLEPESS